MDAHLLSQIRKELGEHKEQMTQFMRDLIAIPGESCKEKEVIERTKAEMEAVGFDEVQICPMGNILGRIGYGERVIAYDAHMDTVGIGDKAEWKWDPYQGKVEEGIIYGRGATDQRGGMVSMVYAAKAIKTLGLYRDFSLYFVGSVQEEDCDGLCWQYLLQEVGVKPELVILTEPTNLNIYRGHRGRMEMEVITTGVSCHGSAPERGVNSIYKMAKVILGIERLNDRLKEDPFLGKGTIAVTHIENETPSLCAIPNRTKIHLDRRLTFEEDLERAVSEVEGVLKEASVEGEVRVLTYATPSYTGLTYPTKKYYPTWVLPLDHPALHAAVGAFKESFGREPLVDKWVFSTNGVAIMGEAGVPCIGFGPANEIYAHSVLDQVPIAHLVDAAIFYAAYPGYYKG